MRILSVLLLLPLALPAAAQEPWPNADTQLLTVGSGEVVVKVPAPLWMGDVSDEQPKLSEDDSARGEWLTGYGFDIVTNSVVVRIEPWDDDVRLEASNVEYGVTDDCAGPSRRHRLPTPKGKPMSGSVVICDNANGRGVIFLWASQMVDRRYLVEYWYRLSYDPFELSDPASWPIPEDEVRTMQERVFATTEITLGGVPWVVEPGPQ